MCGREGLGAHEMMPNPIHIPKLSPLFFEAAHTRDYDLMADYTVLEETALASADAILALGFKDIRTDIQLLPSIVSRAFKLYSQGLAPLIIASGGVNVPLLGGDREARIMKTMLLERGVPEQAIVCEGESANTQENVLFSKDAVKGKDIKSLISIGHALNGRRILMTIAQNWPEIEVPMCSNVWFPGFDKTTWMNHPDYFREGIQQFDRLAYYASLGLIKEINVNGQKHEPHRNYV